MYGWVWLSLVVHRLCVGDAFMWPSSSKCSDYYYLRPICVHPLSAGWLWVQAGHCRLHHQHHWGEPREQRDRLGPPVWVHRGLRTHSVGHQDPAPSWQRGPTHTTALQIHPLHLQPGGAGERGCSRRWGRVGKVCIAEFHVFYLDLWRLQRLILDIHTKDFMSALLLFKQH